MTLSVTIISFGLPSAYGKRMVKCNKLLCAQVALSRRHIESIIAGEAIRRKGRIPENLNVIREKSYSKLEWVILG